MANAYFFLLEIISLRFGMAQLRVSSGLSKEEW
jgi:hypothetical protein